MKARRRRLAATISTLVAVTSAGAAGYLALKPSGGSDETLPGPEAALLSPRRAPEAFSTLIGETRLAARLDTFADSISATSCLAVDADSARIYSHQPAITLIPASSLKLTTAAAFLAKLGGTGTFTTIVRGSKPDSDGIVNGNLTLVGGGDPLLSTLGYVAARNHPPTPPTDIAKLASKLKAAGVRRVTGGIAVSDNRYDTERRVPTWKNAYTTTGDVGPIGALVVDDGFLSYAPKFVAATDPGVAAGGDALGRALEAIGVDVDGATTRTTGKGSLDLASITSAPYVDVVGEMLRESDNNTAELLLKELAHAGGDAPATRAEGADARLAALRGLGISATAVKAIDGSGLDRSDRASCDALLATLTTRPGGYDLETMLATAGQTGTLDDRFKTSPLAGKLRAKTGSLDNVTALVGVADRTAPRKLRFAFISNGPFTDAGGKAIQDRLVAALATYPDAPAAATLAP